MGDLLPLTGRPASLGSLWTLKEREKRDILRRRGAFWVIIDISELPLCKGEILEIPCGDPDRPFFIGQKDTAKDTAKSHSSCNEGVWAPPFSSKGVLPSDSNSLIRNSCCPVLLEGQEVFAFGKI